MKFLKDGHEARRVDVHDHDGLCELIAWCGGRAVDEDEFVIAVPTPLGEDAWAKDQDWLIRDITGVFYVYRHPDWRPIVDGWPWFLSRADE